MRPTLVAHAPTRLDFGGGWTDVPPYPQERGGFVCNLAIDRRATVRLSARPFATTAGPATSSSLIEAACAEADTRNVRVELTSDFPVGSGLGGSSAAGVALAAALARWNGNTMLPSELAEWSRRVEVSGLQVAGGRQDHYAAAFGGALALTFDDKVHVRQIGLSDATAAELERRLLLIYTGESRISGDTISAVLDAYQAGRTPVLHALDAMKALAVEMAFALERGDIAALGALVDEHWAHQRALHPRITTQRIDTILKVAKRAGAIGLKALGASGGGCVVIVTPDGAIDAIADAVGELGTRLHWQVSHCGVETHELPLP